MSEITIEDEDINWERDCSQTMDNLIKKDQSCVCMQLFKCVPASLPSLRSSLYPTLYWTMFGNMFSCGEKILTRVLLNPDKSCLCKQCRSRSVGFWNPFVILEKMHLGLWFCLTKSLALRSDFIILDSR